MATVGETKLRFGRSYIFLNPGSTPADLGTWRLTAEDTDTPGPDPDASALIEEGVVAGGVTVANSQLLSMNATGQLVLADASSQTAGNVVGVALSNGSPGDTISYTRNQAVTLVDRAALIDDASDLEVGKYYFLSAVNPGCYTRTPDTTTTGAVLVQIGMAISPSDILIEIQPEVLI